MTALTGEKTTALTEGLPDRAATYGYLQMARYKGVLQRAGRPDLPPPQILQWRRLVSVAFTDGFGAGVADSATIEATMGTPVDSPESVEPRAEAYAGAAIRADADTVAGRATVAERLTEEQSSELHNLVETGWLAGYAVGFVEPEFGPGLRAGPRTIMLGPPPPPPFKCDGCGQRRTRRSHTQPEGVTEEELIEHVGWSPIDANGKRTWRCSACRRHGAQP